MLSVKEVSSVLSVLNEEDKPLEFACSQFQRNFGKGEQFKVACCLYVLLEDTLLQKLTQRITAFYILYDLYRTEPLASNPFLPIFIDTLQNEIEPAERNFVVQLLGSPPKEVNYLKLL